MKSLSFFFPDTTLTEAGLVVNRIRENIANAQFPAVKHITISAGVCELAHDGDDREKALVVADQLLYRAKHEGRNRVVTQHIRFTHPEVRFYDPLQSNAESACNYPSARPLIASLTDEKRCVSP